MRKSIEGFLTSHLSALIGSSLIPHPSSLIGFNSLCSKNIQISQFTPVYHMDDKPAGCDLRTRTVGAGRAEYYKSLAEDEFVKLFSEIVSGGLKVED
jgi:hypothetical protein